MSRPLDVDPVAENAQAMALRHPDTFEAPTAADLDDVRVGDHVKICVSGERFWVRVTALAGERIVGDIDNDLIGAEEHGLRYGDCVSFDRSRVYQTLNRRH